MEILKAQNEQVSIIGGGLAGCEAAWQAAQQGAFVTLYEMRPVKMTGAHTTGNLAELVCSNSLGTLLHDRGTGLLIEELRICGSLLIQLAIESRVPAGSALAVDRDKFSATVLAAISQHPRIKIIRQEVTQIPDGMTIISSGPLTSDDLAVNIAQLTGKDRLFFYDAVAPIVSGETIDMEKAFSASRYGRGEEDEGDYLNCPLNKEQYSSFINELIRAEHIELKDFEQDIQQGVKAGGSVFFERCLPVEQLAARGEKALAFGPMRPTGLTDPRTGRWPHAIVQLRHEDTKGDLYNLVGFQTNLTYPEQERVFHLIPGLEKALFVRYGQMHRNTFLCAPEILQPSLQMNTRHNLLFAGQLTGVEGYAGNIATGLLAGINAARILADKPVFIPPTETMLGSLIRYITSANADHFQPMKANFGLLPEIQVANKRVPKRQKYQWKAERATKAMQEYWNAWK